MSAERVVNHGDFLTIDVAGLSDELVASLRAHQRVMDELTANEWREWCVVITAIGHA